MQAATPLDPTPIANPTTPVPDSTSFEADDGVQGPPDTASLEVGGVNWRLVFVGIAAIVLLVVLVAVLVYGDFEACFVRCGRLRMAQRSVRNDQKAEERIEMDTSREEVVVGLRKNRDVPQVDAKTPTNIKNNTKDAIPLGLDNVSKETIINLEADQKAMEGPPAYVAIEMVSSEDDDDDWETVSGSSASTAGL